MSKWWKEAIGYQIYPRSFKDSNNDGLGDLTGIREKIPYLKDLGVDFVWLTPVYASPNVDNGYDISDYCAISEDFGTMAEFQALVTEAKAHDIKIIMDLVINHSSDQHEWFKQSRQGADNPYSDYYIWHDPVDGKEPNDWQSIFGGSVWTYDEQRGAYYFHAFAKEQPDLNWDSKAMRQDVYDMIEWWAQQGIDGFRIDAISHIKKDAWDTPVHPHNVSENYQNVEGIDVYLNELSQVLRKNQMMSVGEASGVTAEEAEIWVGPEGYFDMIFEFEHIGLWRSKTEEGFDSKNFKRALVRWQEAVANDKGWNALYMENHDVPRSISVFGDDSPAYRTLSGKSLAMMYLLLQGTPFIYQGQEIGMINKQFTSIDEIDAVDSRNLYKQLLAEGQTPEEAMIVISETTRDNARTPMQWTAETSAGFSDATPWLAVNETKDWLNVATEQADADSILAFYKQLIALRKEHRAFVEGTFRNIEQANDAIFCYERKDAEKTFIVLVNLSGQAQAFAREQLPETSQLVLSNYEEVAEGQLRPYEACLYEV